MAQTWAQLKATSDDDLVVKHDNIAQSTQVGTNYYTAELHHREVTRSAESVEAMTKQTLASTKAVETMTDTIRRYTRLMMIMNALALVIGLLALIIAL